MGGYIPPSSGNLHEFINHLKFEYKNHKRDHKENSERIDLIEIIEALQFVKSPKADAITLGACIFALESIAADCNESYLYYYFSKPENSELYRQIIKGLNVSTENLLDNKTRFVYLGLLLDYINTHPNAVPKEPHLAKKIKKYLTKLITGELNREIDLLLKKPTTRKSLLTHFPTIANEYEKQCAQRPSVSTYLFGIGDQKLVREESIKFLKILDQECVFPESESKEEWPRDYTIRYAAILLIMSQIKANAWRKATYSALYRECQRLVNVEDVDLVNGDLREIFYSDLKSYLKKIKVNPTALLRWEKAGIKNPLEFCKTLNKTITRELDQIKDNEEQVMYMSRVEDFTVYAAQYGVSILIGQAALLLVTKYVPTHFMSALPYMIKVVKPEYLLAATILGTFLKNNVTWRIASSITAPANTIIIYALNQPIIITYKSYEAFSALCKKITGKQTDINHSPDWIKTLMNLPEDVFPEKYQNIKQVIQNVTDIEEDKPAESCEVARPLIASATFK